MIMVMMVMIMLMMMLMMMMMMMMMIICLFFNRKMIIVNCSQVLQSLFKLSNLKLRLFKSSHV